MNSRSQSIAKDIKNTNSDLLDKLGKENSELKEVISLKRILNSLMSNKVPCKIIEDRNKVNGLKWIESFLENTLNTTNFYF